MVHLDNTFVRHCASSNGYLEGARSRAYVATPKHIARVVDENTVSKEDLLSFYLHTQPHGNVQVVVLMVNTHSTKR